MVNRGFTMCSHAQPRRQTPSYGLSAEVWTLGSVNEHAQSCCDLKGWRRVFQSPSCVSRLYIMLSNPPQLFFLLLIVKLSLTTPWVAGGWSKPVGKGMMYVCMCCWINTKSKCSLCIKFISCKDSYLHILFEYFFFCINVKYMHLPFPK